MISSNNPFGGTNRIRFTGYNLSPFIVIRGAPLCLLSGKGNENFGTVNGCRSFFIFFCRPCLFVSEQLYFHTE